MAHSSAGGRSNGVVADENEMESECVFLVDSAGGSSWCLAYSSDCAAAVGLGG